MKRVLTLITTIVLAMTAFADNRIYIEDSGYDVGTDIVLPVYMTNTDSITAFQFDLFLPEDLTLGEEGITLDTERTTVTAHNFTFHKVDYGWYRVICYSTGLNLFKGSEGAIARIHIATPEALGSYEISISDIEMTKPDLTKITCDDVTAHIKVGSGSSADNEDALKRFMEKYEESVGVYNDVKAETVDKLLDEEGNVINKKYEDLVTEFITELDNYKKELDGMKSDAEDEYATGELSDNIEMYIATLTYSDKSIQEAQKSFLMAMENLNKIIAMGECGTCTWVLMSGGQLVIGPSDEEGVEDGVLADWTAVSTTFNGVAPWLAYADSIRSVMFMPGVSALTCERMFSNCVNLEKVQFNDFDTKSVTSMYSMFGDCTNLVEADFSKFNTEHVTDMSNMFVRCSNIKSLDLKSFNTSNVTAMSTMFHGCSKLSNVDLTSFNTESVTDFAGMFASCKSLKELNLSSFNTKNGTYMFSMFEACDSLETLNISNLNTLNANNISGMFTYCDRLTTIVSDNATPSSLKVGTFESFENRANCTLVVPEGTKDLYATADGWNELGMIDDGTEEIADGDVFEYEGLWYKVLSAENMTAAVIKNQSTTPYAGEIKIPAKALYGDYDYTVTALADSCFFLCKEITSVRIAPTVKTLGDCSFKLCENLVSVEIPDSVTEIGARCFSNCFSLDNVVIPSNVSELKNVTFYGCESLTNITIPEGVTSLGEMCFHGCKSLPSVVIPSTVTTIADYCFWDCDTLMKVTNLALIPQEITESTFCRYDTLVVNPDSKSAYKAAEYWNLFNFDGDDNNPVIPADAIASGESGTCIWYITSDNELVIAPADGVSGDLPEEGYNPWNEYGDSIATAKVMAGVTATNCNGMFSNLTKVKTMDLSGLNTQNVTDMYGMFADCSGLTSLDVTSLDTKNVKDMSWMFGGCSGLTSLDVSTLNTENVGAMWGMFGGCSGLTSLDIRNFDTRNVTITKAMFEACSSLTSIDLSNFNTQNVGDMSLMFARCSSLTSIDVSNFDMQNNGHIGAMFAGCSSLTSIDLSKWDTHNIGGMSEVFEDCTNLESIDLSNFNTQSAVSLAYMFAGCQKLTSLDLNNFDTRNVQDMACMFRGCSNLTSLNISNFDAQNVGNMSSMFEGCSSLTDLDLSHINAKMPYTLGFTFFGCNNLKYLDLSDINTESLGYMDHMLEHCTSLTTLNLTGWNTGNYTDARDGIFINCSNLTTIISNDSIPSPLFIGTFDTFENRANCTLLVPEGTKALYAAADGWNELGKILDGTEPVGPEIPADAIANGETGTCIWYITSEGELVIAPADGVSGDLPEYGAWTAVPWDNYRNDVKTARVESGVNATSCAYLFSSLGNMVGIDLGGLNTTNVTDMREMFNSCYSLTSLDLSKFNTQNVTSMYSMMSGCWALSDIDLSSFDTRNVKETNFMFSDCRSLTHLDVTKFNTENVTTMANMFGGCEMLKDLDVTNFNTSNVTDMTGMFSGCKMLKDLDVTNFNTSNVTDMYVMFNGCSALTSLDVSSFNTTNVKSMRYMFGECSNLESLDLSSFNTENVNYMEAMFGMCTNLKTLNLTNFNTTSVTDMLNNAGMLFTGCDSLKTIISNNATPSQLLAGTFNSFVNRDSCTLIVPAGTKALYAAADGWNELGGKLKDPIEIVPNPTEIIVAAVERDYTEAEATELGIEGATGHPWDNQLCIMANRPLSAGEVVIIEFDYWADSEATTNTQCGGNVPGTYVHWGAIGDVDFTTEPQHFTKEFTVPSEADGMQSLTFNLAVMKGANNYHVANFVWCNKDKTETLIDMEGTTSFYVKEGAGTIPYEFGTMPSSDIAQGEIGSCTWTLNKDGELIITPNGANGGELDNWMAKGEKAPWDEYSDEVCKVTIEDGVGGIKDGMLGDLGNLEYVSWNTGKDNIPQGIFGTEENNVIIYAPQGVDSDRDHNVVINGVAEKIILKDGYPLEIPEAFEANYIYYVRDFSKATKTGHNYGWESIVLPYDVQHFVHETKGNLAPFGSEGTTKRPFWLSRFTHDGDFAFANEMKANVPYIIAMPNDSVYDKRYILAGKVAFISYNTTVYPTDEAESVESERATMHGSYVFNESPDYYVINDDIYDGYMPGAVFGSGLTVKPFSAYLNIYEKEWMANRRVFIINENDNENIVDGIFDVNDNENDKVVYDLNGIRVNPSQMKRGSIYLKLKNSKVEKFKY